MNERQEERLSPLPEIGEGFGGWSEAPSYEEGVGVDGDTEGLPSEKESYRVQPCKRMQGDALQKGVGESPQRKKFLKAQFVYTQCAHDAMCT